MMNIKNSIATRYITTYLTSMVIALFCFALLALPVCSIIWTGWDTAFPVWITLACHPLGIFIVSAFGTAKTTPSVFIIGFEQFVFLSAPITRQCNVFGFIFSFWLMCCIFRSTLCRAKAWLAICPFFKLFTTPITDKDGMLTRITLYPSICQTAIFGTVVYSICQADDHFKRFATVTALLFNSISMSQVLAFNRAILFTCWSPFCSPGRNVKPFPAMIAC